MKVKTNEISEKKLNYLLISIICLVGLFGVFFVTIELLNYNEDIQLNGVTLSQQDYQTIKENLGEEYAGFRVCNIKSGNCIGFFEIEQNPKISFTKPFPIK